MPQKRDTSPAVIGVDFGKNSFHIVGQNRRGARALAQYLRVRSVRVCGLEARKWSRCPVAAVGRIGVHGVLRCPLLSGLC
jgi:hypothetical protein